MNDLRARTFHLPITYSSFSTKMTIEMMTELYNLVVNKELSITLGLLYSAELEEVDSVSSVVYKLFEYQQNGYYLVQNVISKEIESTENCDELFESYKFASKISICNNRQYGLDYVKLSLGDHIQYLSEQIKKNPSWSCEIDADSQYMDDKTLKINVETLTSVCDAILRSICTSKYDFPIQFRMLCTQLYQEASKKFPHDFPKNLFKSVGRFVFQNYICAALSCPHRFTLLKGPPTGDLARYLYIISRVLQTMGSGETFSSDGYDRYLTVMNEFVMNRKLILQNFLEHLADQQTCTQLTISSTVRLKESIQNVSLMDITQRELSLKICSSLDQSNDFLDVSLNLEDELNEAEEELDVSFEDLLSESTEPNIIMNNLIQPRETFSLLTRSMIKDELRVDVLLLDTDVNQPLSAQLWVLMQYFAYYWDNIKKILTKSQNFSDQIHSENYIKLTVLMQKLKVLCPKVAQQLEQCRIKPVRTTGIRRLLRTSSQRKRASKSPFCN